MKKILIDTNVFVYAFDKDSSFFKQAYQILINQEYLFFITAKNISELYAVLTRQNYNTKQIKEYINDDIISFSELLFPTNESIKIFHNLMSKYNVKGNRTYDIEIVSIMFVNGIDTIATFNHKDFININEIQILKECL